ncbi:MAG: glycosyltransferase family 4 protein [Isosphaeraceae bacterium]
MDVQPASRSVLVACPDARPPAYQAVIGLDHAGLLAGFVTASYFNPDGRLISLARRWMPRKSQGWERVLRRRFDPEIPADRVHANSWVDLILRAESRAAGKSPAVKRLLARARTEWFDFRLSRLVARRRPAALLVFSDVASGATLPLCRRLGIPTVLSMVHGDVREEAEVLARESSTSPEFFPLYLGDGTLDLRELDWLHRRRLRDLELADRVLVPSEHIARTLIRHGTPPDKVRVIPYAADSRRFRPAEAGRDRDRCTFLFAGGINQRKGISYLLRAWSMIRRPGWKLQLLGPLPARPGPLEPLLRDVELLGRVGHAEMPDLMAAADVFVFPSLFEGSAVVTYEALACGLPSVVTPSAGSVVRDGIEGFEVPPGDVAAIADRMQRLGTDPALRARMAAAARARALEFDWPRYHSEVAAVAGSLVAEPRRSGSVFSGALGAC